MVAKELAKELQDPGIGNRVDVRVVIGIQITRTGTQDFSDNLFYIFTCFQFAGVHPLHQPTMLGMSPNLLLRECIFHKGITVFCVLLDGFEFINTKRGRVVKGVMNRSHQFMGRQKTSSIVIRLSQPGFHAIDKLGRNGDVNQHGLQRSRVTQLCILLEYFVPIVVYILRAGFPTQEQVECDV